MVACGILHTIDIDINSGVRACGDNNGKHVLSLIKINDLSVKFQDVKCCDSNTIIIDDDGYLWDCGRNLTDNCRSMGLIIF